MLNSYQNTGDGVRSEESNKRSSPGVDIGSERKRRRKVLSCFDCRRRKLQCDRVMPACGRCVKAGNASACLYIDDNNDETGLQKAASESRPRIVARQPATDIASRSRINADSLSRLEYQEQRIKQLEAALAQAGFPSHGSSAGIQAISPPESMPDRSCTVVDRDSICLRGRSFKTQFSGSTHVGGMVSHLSQLNQFTKEAFENFPALSRMRKETHFLDDRMGVDDAGIPKISDEDIRAALPDRDDADELIHLYIDTFDPVYHVIHLPSFWQAYEEMWTNLEGSPTHFVALALLMMACVSCLVTTKDTWTYKAFSSSVRARAIRWIRYCEDWIGRQSQKHVTSADFQIRALLWLAKQTSARKAKRTWTDAGTLLRFCMSAGLHRNPDMLPKETSQLDKELRRRIWATAVDFELQASFDRGMVSAPWLLQSDTAGPSNIHDADIEAERPPISRPAGDFTPSSYLALASDSLMLRSTLNAVLNNIRQTFSFDEVKQYTEEIESLIAAIPVWTDRRSDIPQALLALRLRQYVLVLHDRTLRSATTQVEKRFSKTILLETSLQIIETHKAVLANGKFALELFCADTVRVALSIAHLQTFVNAQTDLAFSRTFDLLTPQLMEDVVEMARDRFLRFGKDGRLLWIAISCDGIIKSTRHPAQRSVFLQQAVNNVLSPHQKVLAQQEHALLDAVPPDTSWQGNTGQQAPTVDPTLLDFDDLAEWTLSDWFTIGEFAALPGNQQTSIAPTYEA